MTIPPLRLGGSRLDADPANPADSASALLDQFVTTVRRHSLIFLVVPAVSIALGVLYILITPAQYTATATLLIDSSTLRVLQNQLQPQGDIPLDTIQVGSQVEILLSRKIALAVIRKSNLAEDPEFSGSGLFLGSISPEEKEQRAIHEFLGRRSIARAERTYALNISFTSRNPETAARVANSIAEAYIDDQLGAKYQVVARASDWLQIRINELKAQVAAADRAVLEFKEKKNIVDFGGGAAASGPTSRLIGEQQLFELSSQLAIARGATGDAKARMDRIQQVRQMDVGEAAVADTLKNDVITRLRNQFLDLSARAADLSSRYGADHTAVLNIQKQMEEVRRNIGAELGRIAGSYNSDYEIAKTRQENLELALANLVSAGQTTYRDRLGLAELESSAKAYHAVYDTFLQRYTEALQQQSFPITDARIISEATPPARKSRPISSLILAIAAALGIITSAGLAVIREALDNVFRTSREVEQLLRVKCMAIVPAVQAPQNGGATPAPPVSASITSPADSTRPHPSQTLQQDSNASIHRFHDPLKRYVVDAPLSAFAEALRAVKISAWLRSSLNGDRVIGITSTLPDEGKSTLACNLAMLMADAGRRVILVDADLRNPTLARSVSPRMRRDWLDIADGVADLAAFVGTEPTTGLALLPLTAARTPAHSDEILASQKFRNLIGNLTQSYDFVIVDLPPLAPVVDVRATVPVIECFVYVVEWGRTSTKAVQSLLSAEPELFARLLGVVLNKADLKKLQHFERTALYPNGYYAGSGTAGRNR